MAIDLQPGIGQRDSIRSHLHPHGCLFQLGNIGPEFLNPGTIRRQQQAIRTATNAYGENVIAARRSVGLAARQDEPRLVEICR